MSDWTTVAGVQLEMVERGRGRPILWLHGEEGLDPDAPVLGALAAHGRLLAPSHPGYGHSPEAATVDTVDDLAYLYLDLLAQQKARDAVVIGASLGGWIAAEMAVKSTTSLGHLVLLAPLGIKVGDRETRDIVDIHSIPESELVQLAYFNPDTGTHDYKAMPEAQVLAASRNREATARYGWSPYMHDPKLRGRLHRIRVPTLLLWGAADRILSEPYGRAYCAAIPAARFELIERAGHFPHLEQPELFADRIFAFVEGTPQ